MDTDQMPRINRVDEYFASMIPVGFRFQPTDYELLSEYLIKKIKQEPLPPNRIHVVNLYDFNPDYLTERFKPAKENEWYFFSPTDKRYKNGSRPNRTAGDGYWKSTGSNEPIKHNNIIIGYKRSLVFFMGKHTRHDIKTNWLMKEYTLKNPPAPVQTAEDSSMRLNDWVLCKVYKNIHKNPGEQRVGKRKSNDDNVVVEVEEEVTRSPNINVVEVEQEETRNPNNETEPPYQDTNAELQYPMPNSFGADEYSALPMPNSLDAYKPTAWNYSQPFDDVSFVQFDHQPGLRNVDFPASPMYPEPPNYFNLGNHFTSGGCPNFQTNHFMPTLINGSEHELDCETLELEKWIQALDDGCTAMDNGNCTNSA